MSLLPLCHHHAAPSSRQHAANPQGHDLLAQTLNASRSLVGCAYGSKKYVEEAGIVQDLREEIAQMREAIAQQQSMQNLHKEVRLLREQIAKQKEEREGTDLCVKGLEEALVKQTKANDALEEFWDRVSQGMDAIDEDVIDRNRADSFFDHANSRDEEE
jgi:hypothetical protein